MLRDSKGGKVGGWDGEDRLGDLFRVYAVDNMNMIRHNTGHFYSTAATNTSP